MECGAQSEKTMWMMILEWCGVQVGLDEGGAGPGCAVVNQEGELIVGRDEAFYFNTLDGRGPCFACEGLPSCFSINLFLTTQCNSFHKCNQ